MTLDEFWNVVDFVNRASQGDMDRKCALLGAELRRLSLEEVRSFHDHFEECMDRAYNWPLWAAAYLIGGGCGDDSFNDFRGTLVSMGRETFEQALADPESLADLNYDAEIVQYEGYSFVPTIIEDELSGGQWRPRSQPHPAEPAGLRWDEDKVEQIHPRLAAKYCGGN